MDRGYAEVVQARCYLDLMPKTRSGLAITEQLRLEKVEANGPFKLGILDLPETNCLRSMVLQLPISNHRGL